MNTNQPRAKLFSKKPFEKKAQGAIEYLLLLAAAIVVVAIVVSFLSSTINPIEDTGDEKTYSYLCQTLDSNTAQCACYTGNTNNYFTTEVLAQTYCCTEQNSNYLKKKWGEIKPLYKCG